MPVHSSSRHILIPAIAIPLWLILSGGTLAGKAPLPFQVGERLSFKITWFGIPAGTSQLAVEEQTKYAGVHVLRLASTARSNKAFSLFFRVDDRFESYWDPVRGYPLYYWLRQREGRYRSYKQVIFDHPTNIAFFKRNDEPKMGYIIRYGVQDALSSLYKLRTIAGPIEAGRKIRILAFASQKNWETEVTVEARETLHTRWGEIPALRARPKIAYHEGPLRRKGEVVFWATDDKYRIPLRLSSVVMIIGRVKAELLQAQGIAEDSILARAIRNAKDKGKSRVKASK